VQVEVGLALEMGDALTEIDTAAADDAMNLIALVEKELGEVRTVLTGNTGD
jgi:hypothetical protein